MGLLYCASTNKMKADLLYSILVGEISHKPSEPSVVVSDGNSEAQASDIFIDPAITKEQLKACMLKLMAISFTLAIEAHAAECQRWHDLEAQASSSNPYSQDRRKSYVQENRPLGTQIEDSKTKWLIADLQSLYDEVYEKVVCELLFGKEERLMHKVFTVKL